jgi:lipid-A-disaccharide synthase
LILALPGSRRGEVTRLAPIFGEALRPVLAATPNAQVIVPAAGPVASLVQDMTAEWPGSPIIVDPRGKSNEVALAEKRAAFKAADVALAASGTVSLELAAADTPMVIAYDMNWLSRQIISRMYKLDTATLVNLVSETRTVPEFFGADCKPDKIAAALKELMAHPTGQNAAMTQTMARLGKGETPPGLRAAQAVLDRL